ncbi:MAG: YegP family protein [Alphaproteobacteria bacterium]|nr:YegP family protein [Alphaproteobacteria bacterium]MBU0794367.1 YegP family protein [Alphaproteobacteria bacterium]MBU0875222.1 YegP family protein [Alphaproteobacteria bacterium]MBU1768971.1 YegP family protein [Alphaproteobacteria bacterium]
MPARNHAGANRSGQNQPGRNRSGRHPDSHGRRPVTEADNDSAGAHFEIYNVPDSPAPAIHGTSEDWRWRLCALDGQIMAISGVHESLDVCRNAVTALQTLASNARVEERE